jgi:quercetin dioxygenase-like cupin family protein
MDDTTFRTALARDGFTEVLVRDLPAGQVLADHSHAWDARLLVLAGDMVLTLPDGPSTLTVGQWCEVPMGERHAEHYGSAGTTLLIGRRYPAATPPAA